MLLLASNSKRQDTVMTAVGKHWYWINLFSKYKIIWVLDILTHNTHFHLVLKFLWLFFFSFTFIFVEVFMTNGKKKYRKLNWIIFNALHQSKTDNYIRILNMNDKWRANGKPFRWIHFNNNTKWGKKGFELMAVED